MNILRSCTKSDMYISSTGVNTHTHTRARTRTAMKNTFCWLTLNVEISYSNSNPTNNPIQVQENHNYVQIGYTCYTIYSRYACCKYMDNTRMYTYEIRMIMHAVYASIQHAYSSKYHVRVRTHVYTYTMQVRVKIFGARGYPTFEGPRGWKAGGGGPKFKQ